MENVRSPSVLLCPDDLLADRARLARSYHYSTGSGRVKFTARGMEYDGIAIPLASDEAIQLRDITDGTSNTAMYSERLSIGDRHSLTNDAARKNAKANIWYMPRDYNLATEFEPYQSACLQNAPIDALPILTPVVQELNTLIGYNHVIPPNRPGCYVIARPRHTVVDIFNGAFHRTAITRVASMWPSQMGTFSSFPIPLIWESG
jgi:hypothetical protein